MGSLDYNLAENSVIRAKHTKDKGKKKEYYQRAVRLYKRAAEFFRGTRKADKEALCYLKAAKAARKYKGGEQEAIENFGKAARLFEDAGGDAVSYAREERAQLLRDASSAYSKLHELDPSQEGLEEKSEELMEESKRLEKAAEEAEKKLEKFRKGSRIIR